MAPRIRTLNFLPDIFKTPTNSQFLQATLDQIVDQPNLQRIEGYIGSKLGYGVNAKDKYVTEPTKVRTDYQLAPGVAFLKNNTSTAQDFISYPGIIDALNVEGGLTKDNSRLFNSEFYSWDSFTNLDKIINFNQYYWLPTGPQAVIIDAATVYSATEYIVDSVVNGYNIYSSTGISGATNPTLTLLRGGTYTFAVSQNSQFWIQGEPGVTGFSHTQPNIQTRDVYGVSNNGAEIGIVAFTVPSSTAQDGYNFPGNNLVDVVTTMTFSQLNGSRLSEIGGGIDGLTSLDGMTLMFYNGLSDEVANFGAYDLQEFDQDNPLLSVSFDDNGLIYQPVSSWFFQIRYLANPVNPADPIIQLMPLMSIPTEQKITAVYGTQWVNREFFRDTYGYIELIPYISAPLTTLYYQDGTSGNKVGVIKIVESNVTNTLDIADILGKKTYTSPSGVVFTNGLKVMFQGAIYPVSYQNNEYYVEGVGTAIELIPVSDLVVPEAFSSGAYIPFDSTAYDIGNFDSQLYVPVSQDYITISRNAINKNAWSRSNRWFHIDVINATALYNNNPDLANVATHENKAKRPIIEFYPNLAMFASGTFGKKPIDFFDFRTTDALSYVAGQQQYYSDIEVYTDYTGVITQESAITATITVDSSAIHGTFVVDQFITDSAFVLPENTQIIEITLGTTQIIRVGWSTPTVISPTSGVSLVASTTTVDNYALFEGSRVVFAADTNLAIRNKIYVVNFAIVSGLTPVITLTEAEDGAVLVNEQTVAYRGYNYVGETFFFNGLSWDFGQQKISVNQPPLFDVFDSNNISFSDQLVYLGSSFKGTKLFSYGFGSGQNDSVLGFPVRYSSVDNIGDISFDVSINGDSFSYVSGTTPETKKINTGYVFNYSTPSDHIRQLGWQTAVAPSVQYQAFEFAYSATAPTTTYVCDIPMIPQSTDSWPSIQVYLNNVFQVDTSYSVVVTDVTTVTFVNPEPLIDNVIQILLLSDQISTNAYYTLPINLSNNPLNAEVTVVNIGDIRGQYQSIFYNAPGLTGVVFGSNNYRDSGDLVPYGCSIIQNSASLVLPGTFLRKQNHNLFNALMFNSREYITFKTLLVDTVNSTEYSVFQSAATMLDNALVQITEVKSGSNTFFWSDMLPSKAAYITNTYEFLNSLDTSIYPLSRIYDFTKANYYGVLVYLVRTIGGFKQTIQLIRDTDYTVSTDAPSLTITMNLVPWDEIVIKEYTQTYGNYVPNTPTKLGLYPSTIPMVLLDSSYTTPTYFIVGHDGSYNKLYGDYDETAQRLVDFRDQVLLEFEKRIYNNLKINNAIPIKEYEVLPGFFRDTGYSYSEILQIYSESFLNWVGQNRIDYKTQHYMANDQFTYNYRNSGNKIDRAPIEQGYWRGVYEYFYDTSSPETTPWEMIGFTNQPSWWETRYGPAPYTSDNLVLWGDLAQGINWNNGSPVVITQAIRPQLLDVLPVDSSGNLVSPFISLVGNYHNQTFSNDWVVGDAGPAEFSYRRSSSWPFDLMRILALTKPAEFFNLAVDVDNYKYNTEFNQYLVNDRSHLVISNVEIYGSGIPKTSYINWIVDYEKQLGIDATQQITELLYNLDVRLVYRVAGFSDKNMLKFYVEKGTPNSNNSSLLIPDESYGVLLYDNQPFNRVVYSSVAIQLIPDGGYKVFGNSQTNAYFNVIKPKINGNYERVQIDGLSVQVAKDYYDTDMVIPYGTEFYSVQEVAQFLAGYGRYLQSQGMVFNKIENGIEITWVQMVAEFLYWAQTGWESGSIINVNPAAKLLIINKDSNIVQPLTLQQQNFVLNQNLYPIQSIDLAVVRDGTLFSAEPLNEGDTIAYGTFNISNIEHGIVFDNVTVFNDVIYNLTTGLRQDRIVVRGSKTADWTGVIDAQGFILNQDNIADWSNTTKYTTGSIVKYKNKYWIAIEIAQAQEVFDETQWKRTDYNEIQKGLLPNSSTRSYESTLYYNINVANLEKDADLLSFSLIGFRPRDYLAVADLTDITQINVYRNMIKNKGTRNAVNAFKGATLSQGGIDYNIYENWAIKSAEYGGVLNSNFIEMRLNEGELTGNPCIVGLTRGVPTAGVQQEIQTYSLFNYDRVITSPDVLPLLDANTPSALFPDAGYVNFNDVKMSSYFYSGMSTAVDASGVPVPLVELYVRDYVWIANWLGTWQTYTPVSLGQIANVSNNRNGTVTVTFRNVHNLTKYQALAIVNFNANVDGYFIAASIVDPFRITINLNLNPSIANITGNGVGFRFQSQRVEQPSDIINLPLLDSEFTKNTVWVDTNTDGQWAVYRKSINYSHSPEITKSGSQTFGSAVAFTDKLGYLIGDADKGEAYRYIYNALSKDYELNQTLTHYASFGTTISHADDMFVISQPTGGETVGKVYIYQLITTIAENILDLVQTINAPGYISWGDATAISGDKNWLYISDIDNNKVYVYNWSSATSKYVYATIIDGDAMVVPTTTGDHFSYSLSTDYYGDTLVVGAPDRNYGPLENWGYTYVFTRGTQNWEALTTAPATPQSFVSAWTLNPGLVYVSVNGSLVDAANYTAVSNVLTYVGGLNAGDIVSVSTSEFALAQTLTTETTPHIGVKFGNDNDTTRFASEIIVGAPFELDTQQIEGAVFRFTNAGCKYGMIIGTDVCSVETGVTILLNGYAVSLPAGSAAAAATAINTAQVTNIQASDVDGKLFIQLVNQSLAIPNNKLVLTVTDSDILTEIGILPYTQTQVIMAPHTQKTCQFGSTVKYNEFGSFVASAPSGTRYESTTFDFTDDENDNDTVFDNNTTQWIDTFTNAGAVYMFDYLGNYDESLDNVGKYVYAQSVNDTNLVYGAQPMYGHALDFNNNVVMVGTPGFRPGVVNGQVTKYTSVLGTDWSVHRQSGPIVDVARIQDIQLFSALTNTTLDNLDFMDPLQGKLLGAIRENIDVVSNVDPAGYTRGAISWGSDKVGQLWFDTTNTRFVNYHQGDVVYDSQYWGTVFPGSNVSIYSWIVSNVIPVQYPGPGTPYDNTLYSTEWILNPAGQLVPQYFYWVRNSNMVFTAIGKTLSDSVLESYITYPQSTGISYFAPIRQNVFALYNSSENINANDSVLHIGYLTGSNDDVSHSLFNLIRTDYASDFLPGLPNTSSIDIPESLYNKMLDSMCGVDDAGSVVPDPYLPLMVQTGIQSRPRQSFFYNRFGALKNYLTYANEVLALYPIAESRPAFFLKTVGEVNPSTLGNPAWIGSSELFFDTMKYWEFINWWAPGYDNNTKAAIQVPLYSNLLTLSAVVGLIVSVQTNGVGKGETYVYTSTGTWERIGLQDGTIAFNAALWDYETYRLGFGDNFFDTSVFDLYPSEETRYIVRALNEEIYTNELLIHRNKSLVLMFEYIQSETGETQNYLPWLSKTSFIDVDHTIRELRPISVFQSDNQDFLTGYLNETKPYHVVIKEFVFKYTGAELYGGNITDFDLPAQWTPAISQFISPELVYSNANGDSEYVLGDPIWQTQPYAAWYQNRGVSLTGIDNYQITFVTSYIALNSSSFAVNNPFGFPVTGVVQIGAELIGYSNVNRSLGTINGLTRGVNGTDITVHFPDDQIYIDLPAVLLLDAGRGYSNPPRVSAVVDLTLYPAPIREAVLVPVMSLDSIQSVTVVDPGEGYMVLPEIVFEPSIVVTFPSTSVHPLTSTIELSTPLLATGDLIKLNVAAGGTTPGGLDDNQYYYVGVLQTVPTFIVALYTNYSNSLADIDRVTISSTGTGDNNLNVTARASCVSTAAPIRENQISIKFDRTTYGSNVVDWKESAFYGSFFAGDFGAGPMLASSSLLLDSEFPVIDSVMASAQGAVFELESVRGTETVTWSGRTRNVTDTSATGNVITIIPSEGGAPDVGTVGPTLGFYVGMPVRFDGAVGSSNIIPETVYYVESIAANGTDFTISATKGGPVFNPGNAIISVAGLLCYVGEVIYRTFVSIDYPGISAVTNTTATTNYITVPMTPSGNAGTTGFYPGLSVFFVGEVFGNIIQNEPYYITTVVDNQNITISKSIALTLVNVTSVESGTNYIIGNGTWQLSVGDPIIFTDMIAMGVPSIMFGNIVSGVTYYVHSIVDYQTFIIMTEPFGTEFDPGNDIGTCYATDQKDVLQLTTATGDMTINVGLPISPGQINGQLVSFYPTSAQHPNKSASSVDNPVIGVVRAAIADPVNQLSIWADSRWLSDAYINMPVLVDANYGGLIAGTIYYIAEIGIVNTVVSATGATGFTCLSTAGFYSGMPVTFSGTSLGGTQLNVIYSVDSVVDGFTFTVTGFTPAAYVGSLRMTVTGETYVTLTDVLPGSGYPTPVTLFDETSQTTITQWADPYGTALFDVSWIRGGYRTMLTNPGDGFAVGNTITILGADIGGATPDNNLVLTVNNISVSVNVTSTTTAGVITCNTTTGLVDNDPVVFSGTSFGTIVPGQVYYVTVVNGISVTLSETYGGSTLTLTDDTGFMTLTDNGIGKLYMAAASGTPDEIVTQYYLNVASATECEIFTDPLMAQPVKIDSFIYNGLTSTTLTDTDGTWGTVTVTDISGFNDNDPIVFTGAVFGGIEVGRVYYTYNIGFDPFAPNKLYILTEIGNPSTLPMLSTDTGSCTMAKSGDYVVLPEPFYFDQSIVRYNHQLYQCIISNNDPTFVFGKWELLRSENTKINALDRIFGYYQPTVNMPGLDFTQLAAGVTYPNGTYYGNAFNPNDEFALDTILQDLPFNAMAPAEYVIQGDPFTAGYGPEELVPGVISDNLSMVVTTRPGTNWPATEYAHVGYNVVSVELSPISALQTEFSFANVVQVPAQISVGVINRDTKLGTSLYSPSYSVNWINKIITLATPLTYDAPGDCDSLRIDVYEVGNGDQLEKSNTQIDPLTFNTLTGFNEIVLNCNYSDSIAVGSGVIRPGTDPIEVLATVTDAAPDNTITCTGIEKFVLNGPVTFQGDVFGGVLPDTTYYVKTISLVTHKITISATQVLGIAGSTFVLTADTGSMYVIIQLGAGTPWSTPIVHINGTPLLFGSYSTVTQTKASNNAVTCNTTAGMSIGSRVVFDSSMFGILTPHVTYYVESIVDGNEFTVSATYGGPVIPLTTAYGGALVIVNDYSFGIADNGISAKIIFAEPYTSSDYLTYTVFGETTPAQYGYTLPEIEVFTVQNTETEFTLSNQMSGTSNPTNAIVELNGVRLVNISDYEIVSDTLTLTFTPVTGDIVAVTSYNFTDRQYLHTMYGGPFGGSAAIILDVGSTTNSVVPYDIDPYDIDAFSENLNWLTLASGSTSVIHINDPITFTTPTLGGITAGQIYYVVGILSSTEFTISEFIGGEPLVLTTDIGSMTGYINPATVANIVSISNTITPPDAITNVTGTTAPDILTCDSTSGFVAGQTVIFEVATGSGFGGVAVDGTVYYILPGFTGTDFSISDTPGGAPVLISTSSGIMTAIVGGTPSVRVTTGIAHVFAENEFIRIDGTSGSTQLNNNTYYAKIISPTEFDLYSAPYSPTIGVINYPVTDVNTWTSGGYTWIDRIFTLLTTTATATSTSFITCSDISELVVDTPIIFSGATFGGIDPDTTYYILSIVDDLPPGPGPGLYGITISDTYQGTELTLTPDSGSMGITQWEQTNVDRLWVTVNGLRVPSSSLRVNPSNNVNILTTIVPGDVVTITSMMPSATPDELVYIQNVNKTGAGSVFRAGPETRTWLTHSLSFTDEAIEVNDLSKITNTIVQSATAPAVGIDGNRSIGLLADKRIISQIVVYNVSTSTTLDPGSYFVGTFDTAPVVNITAQVSTGDSLIITTIEGNLIYIFGEQIRFTIVDFANNTISGLQRGTNGTGVRTMIPKYADVYGVLSKNRMADPMYDASWNFDQAASPMPLQISEISGAVFLRTSNNQ